MFESFFFQSSDHLRYENGVHISGPHKGGAPRVIEIRENTEGTADYWIFIFIILEGNNLELQMTPKEMNVVRESRESILFEGIQGTTHADYSLSLNIEEEHQKHLLPNLFKKVASMDKLQWFQTITKSCTLHLTDRGVDIDYYLSDDKKNNPLNLRNKPR